MDGVEGVYYPQFTRAQAEDHLRRMGTIRGDFIIRDTEKKNAQFVISHVVSTPTSNRVHHTLVYRDKNMYLLDDQGMFHTMRELLEFYYHHPVNNTEPLKKPVITMPERRPTVPLKQNILYGGSTPASQPVGHAGAMAGSIGTPQPPTFPRAASMAARPQLPQHRPQQPPQQPAEAMYESVDDFDVMPPKPEAKTTITYDDLPPARSGGAPVVSAASHRGSNSAPVYEDLESAHRPTFSPMNRPNKAVSSAGYVMMSAPATLPTAGPLAGPPSSFSSPAAAATPPPRPSSKSKPWKAGSRASMGGSFATAPNDVDLEALIRRLTADMGGGDDY